jgi:L,D-peptidoglycan transpeptidase YkuD (ErfK/YbiS/YcfS/YnhG family)
MTLPSARSRRLAGAAVLVLLAGLLVGWVAWPPVAEASTGPHPVSALPFDARAVPGTQVVYVTGRPRSSYGRIELWMRWQTGWYRNFSVPARLGTGGISARYREGASYTPAGTFTVTEAFGRRASPGTVLRYRSIGSSSNWWWVSDPHSTRYNQPYYCRRASCPFTTSYGENLGAAGSVYDYALVMDVNRRPVVPGRGSAFFIHIGNGRATAGCVSTDRSTVVTLLRSLKPAARPVVVVRAT